MAAPAQAPSQAEPVRHMVTSTPGHTPQRFPGPQNTTVSRAEDTALFVPQDYKRHREKGALGTDSLGLWASGEESNSYRMVAKAWPKGPSMFIDRGPFCMIIFPFCFETKSPCLAQALAHRVYQTSFVLWSPPHSCWD